MMMRAQRFNDMAECSMSIHGERICLGVFACALPQTTMKYEEEEEKEEEEKRH